MPRLIKGLGLALCLMVWGTAFPLKALAQAEGDPASDPDPVVGLPASPYLPLGHWAYPILDQWIAEGRAPTLSPFTRPFRRIEVARVVDRLSPEDLGSGGGAWLEELRRELAPEIRLLSAPAGNGDQLRGRLAAGGAFHTQTHPDPLRPALDGPFSSARLLEEAEVELDLRMANVVGGVRIVRLGRHRHDPRFPSGQVVPSQTGAFFSELSPRMEEAYLEIQGRRARVSFGRQYRNWGGPGESGFIRSSGPYSFDELGYRFGNDRVFLIGNVTSFRDQSGDTARYHAAHRLEIRPRDNLMIAVSEASIHGGPGEPLDVRVISPLSIWEIARDGERDTQSNILAQFDVWWRPVASLVLFGSLVADSPPGVGACCEAGGSVGMELPTLLPDALVRFRLSVLESLMYRTSRTWEEYSVRGVGLGWDKVDLMLATAEVLWFPRQGLSLRPRIDLQMRGEESEYHGRIRPRVPDMEDFPRLLGGRTETTLRTSVAGDWRYGGGWLLSTSWDMGLNRIRHFRHRAGDHRMEVVGTVGVRLQTPSLLLSLPGG